MEAVQNLLHRLTAAASQAGIPGGLQSPHGLFALLAFVVLVVNIRDVMRR